MTIIVTGGAGFIGSNFVFHMLNKYPDYRIVCLDCLTYAGNLSTLEPVMDNPNFRFVKESITDRDAVYKLFEEEHPDMVVNFAAESHVDRSIENPQVFLDTNIIGTSVLMDACRKYGIKRYKMTGPIAFLTLMENAEWVLTQSFHGTLFSAMFHKNFWSYRAPSVNKPGDDRAIAILKQLGLADRYQVIDDLPNQNFTKTIDYANTDDLISKLRSDAFSYLDKIMNSI